MIKNIKLFKQTKSYDYWIGILALIFSVFGLMMIYEASNVVAFRDFGDKLHFVKDQLIWFVLGVVALIVSSVTNYKKLYNLSVPLLFITLVSLIAVFIPGIGLKLLGAHRWINLGKIVFQPSELAKISLVLYLSSWLSAKNHKSFFAFIILFSLIVGLVVLQPDLGTAFILTIIFLVVYFISGAPIWQFLFLIPISVCAILALAVTSPYRFARVTTFLNPTLDPLGSSYHIRQILVSLGSGGLWGLGIGASRQKYQYLPEATTDSIFAIIGEEFGFIGTFILIVMFAALLYKIYKVAKNAPDKQSFLLAGGVMTYVCTQIIINLGSMVALFPLTGVPLPFISYGGSSLIISLFAIGIVVNISKYAVKKK